MAGKGRSDGWFSMYEAVHMYEWFLLFSFFPASGTSPRWVWVSSLVFFHSTELRACSKMKATWDMSGGVGRLWWFLLVARRYQWRIGEDVSLNLDACALHRIMSVHSKLYSKIPTHSMELITLRLSCSGYYALSRSSTDPSV